MLPDVTDFCRLYLLRHPQLASSHAELAVGGGAAPLSRRGQARTLQWVELLAEAGIAEIVSASQPQCLESARALGQGLEVSVLSEPRLDDQGLGVWQGRSWQELVAEDRAAVTTFFENYADATPPDGESLGVAIERVLAWWGESAPREPGKTFAVVAAGAVISGFVAALLGLRLSRHLSLSLPAGGVGVVDVFANGLRLSAWNADGLAD